MIIPLLLLVLSLPTEDPTLVRDDGMAIRLTRDLLQEPGVAKQFRSGLTLTLILRHRAGKGPMRATVVETRFEPWDEVFYVTIRGDGVKTQKLTLKSMDALLASFCDKGLPLGGISQSPGKGLEVRLSVLPFSTFEQERVRQWIRTTDAGPPSQVTTNRNQTTTSIVLADLLVAGSIKRSSMLSYQWTLPWP